MDDRAGSIPSWKQRWQTHSRSLSYDHDSWQATDMENTFPENANYNERRSQSPLFQQMLPDQHVSQTRSLSRQSLLRWTAEVLSVILGGIFLTVIVVVLYKADGNCPPEWPLNITLNTFLAFLTSLAKIAFMFPIFEGLGQLKWMWFMADPKPLSDFKTFDEASKGSWGCVKLLLQFKGLLACLGAIITLSGFLTSTMTQQAIEFRVQNTESANGTATITRATSFSLYSGDNLVLAPQDARLEKQALLNGAFFSPNETVPYVIPICSSGDCDWDPYGSLAVCSEVVNMTEKTHDTDLLESLRNATTAQLAAMITATLAAGNTLGLNNTTASSIPASLPIVMGPLSKPTGSFNSSVTDLIINDQFIAFSNEPITNASIENMPAFEFMETAFYWCTKTFSTQVKDGRAVTTEIGSRILPKNKVPVSINSAWSPAVSSCLGSGQCNDTHQGLTIELEAPPDADGHDNYTLDVLTATLGSALVAESMQASVLTDKLRGFSIASTGGGMAEAFSFALFGGFLSAERLSPSEQFRNIDGVVRNMAQTLTNLDREGTVRYAEGRESAIVHGIVFAPQTLVKIHWGWIAMIAAQLLSTSVFLAATIAYSSSSNLQILKGSPLATMCALDKETRQELGGINDFEALNQRARNVQVRLERRTSGTAVWLAREPRPAAWYPEGQEERNKSQDWSSIEEVAGWI